MSESTHNTILDKLNTTQICIGAFTVFTAFLGITSIYNYTLHYTCYTEDVELFGDICIKQDEMSSSIQRIQFDIQCVNERLHQLQDKLDNLLESPILTIGKDKPLSPSRSDVSVILQDSMPNTEPENESEEYDDELINECYDSIPLNNSKKVTGLRSFIWFAN